MSTPMITMAPRAMIIATPCCDSSVLRIVPRSLSRAAAGLLSGPVRRLPAVAQAHFDPQRVAKYGATGPAQVHERRRLPPHNEADARHLEGVRGYSAEGVVIGELHPAGPVHRVRLERAGDRLSRIANRYPAGDAVEEPDIPLVVGVFVDPVVHAAEEPHAGAYDDGGGGRRCERELVARIGRRDVPRLRQAARSRAPGGEVRGDRNRGGGAELETSPVVIGARRGRSVVVDED